MSEEIKLSIAIPTYNQPGPLSKTLSSIVPQLVPGVEVLIRDDSSNDDSEKLVRPYLAKGHPIRYIRGEKIGLDAADIFLIEASLGEYVWWFGDDEMAPGGVEAVLKLVNRYPEIDFMWVNSKSKEHGALGSNWGESRFFKDGNEALEELSDLLNFISALVFKREKALPATAGARKYFNSCVGGLYPILYILAKGGKAYYLAEPFVIAKDRDPEKPLWYDTFQVNAVSYYKVFYEFSWGFSRHSIKRALTKTFQSVWRGILVYRAKGITTNFGSKSSKLPILFKYYWSFPDFWKALPFLLMPRWLVRICYKLYKKIKPQKWDRFRERYYA